MLGREERKKRRSAKKTEKLRQRSLKYLNKARDKGGANFPEEYSQHDPDLRSLRRHD